MTKSTTITKRSGRTLLRICFVFSSTFWVAVTLLHNATFNSQESSIQNLSSEHFLKKIIMLKEKHIPASASAKSSLATAKKESLKEDRKDPNNRQQLPRVLAIVFPQFHRDAINDKLWGVGFTDWDNLRNAPMKNRLGFDIPRPTELGYYDYTDPIIRKKQGEMAKEYGIDGFVFHHYWFYDATHPGPNLHAPLEKMLQDGYPNIPFCLHWCAVKWTATWHGKTAPLFNVSKDGVLQLQYFPQTRHHIHPAVKEHYKWLRQFFHHPNYIKVNHEPVFMVYQKTPLSFAILRHLRQLAKEDGFPGLYITVALSRPHTYLQPLGNLTGEGINKNERVPFDIFNKTTAYPKPHVWNEGRAMTVPDWCQSKSTATRRGKTNQKRPRKLKPEIPGILTSFDNTPRRSYKEAHLWSAEEPHVVVSRFKENLHAALYFESCCSGSKKVEKKTANTTEIDNDDRFILINAMNEWAEGMALEPSNVFGRSLLEAVQQSKNDVLATGC